MHAPDDDVTPREVSAAAPEPALIRALDRASAACQWDVVKLIAEELRARRLEQSQVADLEQRRTRQG